MKTFQIAGIEIPNRYVLAPLAGFTDYSMRKLSYEHGAGLCYTEMESCEALVYQSKITIKDLEDTLLDKKHHPNQRLALQIFGGKKDIILQSIPLVGKYATYDFLDFNCGCPVPKVIRQQAGSYWLNRQDELLDLMKELVKISTKPVIIKIRIGFSQITDIVPLCKKLEEAGVAAIAVHGRTRKEMFSSPVHYDVIRDIKKNVNIPIIANGEITPENLLQVEKETGADAFMIGQGAIGNPTIFSSLIAVEEGKEVNKPSIEEQIFYLKEHLNTIFTIKDEHTAASIMRAISIRYFKGFADIKKYKTRLVQCNTQNEYLNILNEMLNDQIH